MRIITKCIFNWLAISALMESHTWVFEIKKSKKFYVTCRLKKNSEICVWIENRNAQTILTLVLTLTNNASLLSAIRNRTNAQVSTLRGTVTLLAFIVKDNWLSIFKQFKTWTGRGGAGAGVGWMGGRMGKINAHPFLMVVPAEIITAFAHHKYHRVKNRWITSQQAPSTCN